MTGPLRLTRRHVGRFLRQVRRLPRRSGHADAPRQPLLRPRATSWRRTPDTRRRRRSGATCSTAGTSSTALRTAPPSSPGMPLFVWSDSVRRRGHAMGLRNYSVIGSVWLYLLKVHPELATPAKGAEGTIFYPFHGWEGQHVLGDHGRLDRLDQRARDGPGHRLPVLARIRKARDPQSLRGAGFRVITHGYRGRHWRQTDANFLVKQLARAPQTHAGSPPTGSAPPSCTALRSACSPGSMVIRWCWSTSIRRSVGRRGSSDCGPRWTSRSCRPRSAREFTDTELGVDHVADPAEIRELFRWTTLKAFRENWHHHPGPGDEFPACRPRSC